MGSVRTSHASGICEYESQPQLLQKLATLLAPVVQVDSAGSRWSRLQAPLTEAKKVQQAKAEAKQGSIFLTMTLRYLAHSFFIQIEHFSRSSVFAQPVRSKLQQSIQLSIIALKIVVFLLWLIYICPDLRATKTNWRNKQHKTVLRGLLKELPYFNYKGNLAEFHGRLLLRSRLFWICPNASSFRRRGMFIDETLLYVTVT